VQQAHADIKRTRLSSWRYYPHRIPPPPSATTSPLIVWHAVRRRHLLLDSSDISSEANNLETDSVYSNVLAKQRNSKLLKYSRPHSGSSHSFGTWIYSILLLNNQELEVRQVRDQYFVNAMLYLRGTSFLILLMTPTVSVIFRASKKASRKGRNNILNWIHLLL